ncbi:MAG: hypothetical protein QM648_07235 [Solirubrobacterales bacterium]
MRRISLLISLCAVAVLVCATSAGAAMPTISAGPDHTCAIGDTGGVWCWGDNQYGQLGDGTTADSPTPVPVHGLPSAPLAIVAADQSTCVIAGDKTLWCWGLNTSGQLGNGSVDVLPTANPTPAQIPILGGIVRMSGSGSSYCALLSDQTLACWGDNTYGQLGNGELLPGLPHGTPAPVSGMTDARNVSVGPTHSCAVLNSGLAQCWGDNTHGALGDGTETPSSTPVSVQGLTVAAQSFAGDGVSCASVGLGDMRCWGQAGKLGNPAGSGSLTPVGVPEVSSTAQLGGSAAGVCAIAGGQALVCWGGNPGNGTPGPALTYSGVDLGVLGLSSGGGSDTTCYVVRGGTAKCWGSDNSHGQLGYTGSPSLAAVPVANLDLITGRYTSTQIVFGRNGKVTVDKKKKNYSVKAKLVWQLPSLIGQVDGCSGRTTVSAPYSYKTTKRVKGKKKTVTVKKTITARGAVFASGETCVSNVTLKNLPVKYLNHKSLTLKASFPGNAAIQPFTKTASRFTLPKVKIKKK